MLNNYLLLIYFFNSPTMKAGQFWNNLPNSCIDSNIGKVFKTTSFYHNYEDILTMRPSQLREIQCTFTDEFKETLHD